jgi:hypothetical protein
VSIIRYPSSRLSIALIGILPRAKQVSVCGEKARLATDLEMAARFPYMRCS